MWGHRVRAAGADRRGVIRRVASGIRRQPGPGAVRVWLGMLCALVALVGGAAQPPLIGVDFTDTPVPTEPAEMLHSHSRSKAVLRYADGSTTEHPLSYHILFHTGDKVAGSRHEAGRLFDATGRALVDPNGDPVIAENPDGNSLLQVDGGLFLVTHYESDWLLANGASPRATADWYRRMPMGMTLTALAQAADGALSARAQRPIDFASVQGLWTPCFASQTPWNTHLGGEEDYDLYFTAAAGEAGVRRAASALAGMTEVYFDGQRRANPYHYGYIVEVRVGGDGTTEVVKHYNLGRATWEQALVMPDRRTVYYGDDGDHVGLFLFVADRPADLTAGTLYAARWHQLSAEQGGAAQLGWIRLGHVTRSAAQAIIDSGIRFEDIFEFTSPIQDPDWQAQGFRAIRAGHSRNEYLRLRPGRETAASFLETRRYAAYLGATTEFNKMEGVALDAASRQLYVAMSNIDRGMLAEPEAPADHIRLPALRAGATYRLALAGGRSDSAGRPIASDWVATSMTVPRGLLGADMATDARGNSAPTDRVANPDNLAFSARMRTLFIAEDSDAHVNNFLWAYNVDTGRLSRILSVAAGAESTGLQVIDDLGGHAYILSNAQHPGAWPGSMPADLRRRLRQVVEEKYGVNRHDVPNYHFAAPVGYLGGIPGL